MSTLRRRPAQQVLAVDTGSLSLPTTITTRIRSLRAKRFRHTVDIDTVAMSPAGVVMYNCREILEQVLSTCEWRVLMMFARLERYSRTIVQYVARKILKDILAPWMDDTDGFFLLLESTGGGITGSVARKLMEINCDSICELGITSTCRHHQCYDLNVIFPTGRFSEGVTFFRREGYTKIDFPSPAPSYSQSVIRFATCSRVGQGTRPVSYIQCLLLLS